MSTEGSKSNLLSSSEDITVSEGLQSSQSILMIAVKEDSSNSDLVASNSTSGEEALAVEETISGAASNADKNTARESTHSASTNLTEESSEASVVSSTNEESGDSGTSFVKRIRKVSFASRVCEDNGGAVVDGTSRDLTTPTLVAGEHEDTPQSSIEVVNPGCCPEYRGPMGYFRIKMMYFRESKYLLPFQLVLLAMPISSGFMGAENMYRCPASPAVAILFFMMGIIGTVFLCGRIYNGFKRALFPHDNSLDPTDGLPIAAILLLGILFTTELGCFFNMEPEFTHTRSSHKFCDAKFYYFATWMNYSGIALIILLMLLHCPGSMHSCTRSHVPHVTHELLGGLDH